MQLEARMSYKLGISQILKLKRYNCNVCKSLNTTFKCLNCNKYVCVICQRKHWHQCQSCIHTDYNVNKAIYSCKKCVCGKWVCIKCWIDHIKTSPNHRWCNICKVVRPYYDCLDHKISVCKLCRKIHCKMYHSYASD